ncbi:MBL fold metallo-hydrolase [Saprospira grandis]|uniref:Beta-lactamase domain protein n=1 Tax=Saprospira grandis (strain Lewin) TaxID=984262 RepID=H6L4R5_SAPGL|nr:MBL fold metallo-hydrolase [Saprospira grandis]AFC25090.1 beta-lactamase domain protein [Saprospira grandis str. Lewin]
MAVVQAFTFNMFQENTYIVYDQSKACIIVDPGCYTAQEQNRLKLYIEERGLKPEAVVNTHCHLDHVFGNAFACKTWDIPLYVPEGEAAMLEAFPRVAQQYGVPNVTPSPKPNKLLKGGETFSFGQTSFKLLYCPGHSPASLCFYSEKDHLLLAGDVLFFGSIGRTDLPGGNYEILMQSIQEEILPLPDETVVYSGHGPKTTVGRERKMNPFIKEMR